MAAPCLRKQRPHILPPLPCPAVQEVALVSCSFEQPSPAVLLPPSVRKLALLMGFSSKPAAGVDFGLQASGLEEGKPRLACWAECIQATAAAGSRPCSCVACTEPLVASRPLPQWT